MKRPGSFTEFIPLLLINGWQSTVTIIFLISASSLLELIGIFLVVQYLQFLIDPEKLAMGIDILLQNNQALSDKFFYFIIIFITLSFAFRIKILSRINQFIEHSRTKVTGRLVANLLHGDLKDFNRVTSSDYSKRLLGEVDAYVSQVFRPFVLMISNLIIFLVFSTALFILDPGITVLAGFILGSVYTIIYLIVRGPLNRFGVETRAANENRFKKLINTINSIVMIKFYREEKTVQREFNTIFTAFSSAQANVQTSTQVPGIMVEALILLGSVIVVSIGFTHGISADSDEIKNIFDPTVALFFVFSAMRLKPALQSVYRGFASLKYGTPVIMSILDELGKNSGLSENDDIGEKLDRFDRIEMADLCYFYTDESHVGFKAKKFIIRRGEKVCVFGESGSGKSTFLKLLVGLYSPTSGRVALNNIALHNVHRDSVNELIGFVSQEVNLIDGSLIDNIVYPYGRTEVDGYKLDKALEISGLKDNMDKYEITLDDKLGDGGSRLSGGQRQKLALARALYREPQLLILDEPTSALDLQSENEFLDLMLNKLPDTAVLVVSHSENVITRFFTHYRIMDGTMTKCSA